MTHESFVLVHVGQSDRSQRNLEFGIESRSWGFPEWRPEYESARPRFAVLATGVGPRVQLDEWLTHRITLVLCEVRGGFHEGRAPHWPDEEAENAVKYPVRFGIEPLVTVHDVPLAASGPLGLEGSDGIRLSGIGRGKGVFRRLDPQPLLDTAKVEVNWEREREIPLDRLRIFPVEQIVAPKAPKGPTSRGTGTGFLSDPRKRKAVELHAEDLAAAHYEQRGWTVERVGKPYDLRCVRAREELRVEVKGTTGAATSVELTANEVTHALDSQHTVDLYVVSDISVVKQGSDYVTSGGNVSHFQNWSPAEKDLRVTKYEYRLPLPR
ncbi:DUF3883 domain-containing protein [Streptomyces sp. NPDC093252]|uniref:protein NO VEIN domain-containing protein n=1 Tax=Streptomyces sp. NPDC093252 TaxID=3154980 RepID=UPI00341EFAFF